MRYLLYCILFLISIYNNAYGQQFVIDSLSQLLKVEENPIRIADIHLGLARAYNFVNIQTEHVRNSAVNALELSKKHGYQEGEAVALILEAQWKYHQDGDPNILYEAAKKAVAIAQSISSKSLDAFAQYHLAEYYIYDRNDYKTGIDILTKTINAADETVSNKNIGNCHKVLGLAYETNGQYRLALNHFEKAISHYNKAKNHPFIDPKLGMPSAMDADFGIMNWAQGHMYSGRMYVALGEFEKAIEYITIAKNVLTSIGTPSELGFSLENLGFAYQSFGKGEKAIEAYQQAAILYEEIKSDIDLSYLFQKMGQVYFLQRDYSTAKSYLTKSQDIAKYRADTVLLIDICDDFGKFFSAQENFEQALFYMKEREKFAIALNDSTTFTNHHINFGQILLEQKKYHESIQHAHQALKWSQYFNNLDNHFVSYQLLALNHIAISQFDSATHFLSLATPIVEQTGDLRRKIDLQKTYSELFERQGDYQNALTAHKKYFELYNEFYTEKGQQKLKEEQVRQNVVDIQKEKDLAKREAALLAQRNQLYLTLAIALLGILLVGFYLFNQLRKTKKQIELQNLQLQELNATKDKFFGIIAHDIRSPIVALEGVGEQMDYYLKKNQPEKLERLASRIDSTAKRLSALLDNLLNWALLQQGVIPYHPKALKVKEIGAQIFQMFQHNADTKGITLDLQVDNNLSVYADESALNTILRNLISNAIKFTPQGGKVSLSTITQDNQVFIQINDTGTGIAVDQLAKLFSLEKNTEKGTDGEKGTGLGLTLVKELVELNNGSISIDSLMGKGSSFKVGLHLVV
ncbi:MAG: ATP-binding protein [Saprospiraceae bacterium]